MFEGDEAEDLVTVVVSHDANEAALLKGLLEDHGLVVATPGLEHRSMLGMAGSFVKIPIKVPRRDLAEAEALLEALNEGGDEDEDEDEDEDDIPEEAPRRRRIAIFVACVLTFGCGHFYVRQNVAGLVLALIELSAMVVLCGGEPLAAALLAGCVLADIVGSFAGVSRQERGLALPSGPAQVLRTVPVVAVAAALCFGAIQAIPEEDNPLLAPDAAGPMDSAPPLSL